MKELESERKEIGVMVGLLNRLTDQGLTVTQAMSNQEFMDLYETVKEVILKKSSEIKVEKTPSTKKQSLDSVDVNAQEKLVLDVLRKSSRPLTRREITAKADLFHQSTLGRVDSLLDKGLIYVCGSTKCSETGKQVQTLAIVPKKKVRK